MEDFKNRFRNWKEALESEDLKINIRKTRVVVSGSEKMFIRRTDLHGAVGD